jgi:2-polyprenyl-3-methyl-5-hydroxy-6-metoxy-1,4-benzoquinol methylase
MSDIRELKECLCCGSDKLQTILDLKKQPLANSYHDNSEKLDEYPLALNLCEECYHLQLTHAVNPDLMFKNYLYVSGTSKTLRDYFDWFASFTLGYIKPKNVLDIACNDGSQLNSYKKHGIKTVGIDPATNLKELSSGQGHEIVVDYFTEESISKLSDDKFDIITAQNVFAHNTYPLEFLKLCKNILSDDGYLFIQTSQADMVVNKEFDTIYHEHISFFNPLSMKTLVERSGLELNDIIKSDIHGNSFIFVISKSSNRTTRNVGDYLEKFKNDKLNEVDTYMEYGKNASKIVSDLKETIELYKYKGYSIIGYGAAAKGNTLLNFGDIDLDYILDDNELKHELYTPGMDILIKSPDFIYDLRDYIPIVFIPLAWNFYKEIREKIKERRNKDTDVFIKYFPELQILD